MKACRPTEKARSVCQEQEHGPPGELHDAARKLAIAVVDLFTGCLREEELMDAYYEVYELAKIDLEQFVISQSAGTGKNGTQLGRCDQCANICHRIASAPFHIRPEHVALVPHFPVERVAAGVAVGANPTPRPSLGLRGRSSHSVAAS